MNEHVTDDLATIATPGRPAGWPIPAPRDGSPLDRVPADVDQADTDTDDDRVPLRVLLDAAAAAMAGRPADALRATFDMVASVSYRSGTRDGYLTRMRDERAVPDPASTPEPVAVPVVPCPPWCVDHHRDDTEAVVMHYGQAVTVGQVDAQAVRLDTVPDGRVDEMTVFVAGCELTPADARRLAAVLVEMAGQLDGGAR